MTGKLDSTFYDPFIFEECDFDEVFEDGFLDRTYMERDLSDDLIFGWMKERLQDVEGAISFKIPKELKGESATPYGTVTEDRGKIIVNLGCTQVKPPMTEIVPDYEPALIALKWYMTDYHDKPEAEYPFIPVSQPLVPHVAKEKPASTDSIDAMMEKAGALIFSPSYSFAEEREEITYVPLIYEDKPAMDRMVAARIPGKRFLFTSRSNYIFHWSKSYRVAALEFNPFHPMAYPYIRSFIDNGVVISGTYKWGRRERPFYFSRTSRKQRFHYEIWGNMFGYRNYYLSMFDMVANFDMRDMLIFSEPRRAITYTPQFVIEGYFPARFRPDFAKDSPREILNEYEDGQHLYYSQISSPRRSQLEGKDFVRSFYSNIPIIIRSKGKEYLDVTSLYELRYYNMSRWEMYVVEKATGKTVVSLMYTDKKEKHTQKDPRIFIQYSIKTSSISVFVRKKNGYGGRACYFSTIRIFLVLSWLFFLFFSS